MSDVTSQYLLRNRSHHMGRCLEDYGKGTCEGPVEWHSIDPGRTEAFPRCEKHWEERLRRANTARFDPDVVEAMLDVIEAAEAWEKGHANTRPERRGPCPCSLCGTMRRFREVQEKHLA